MTFTEHPGHPRTVQSTHAVHTNGHYSVAYFSTFSDASSYEVWLRSLNYSTGLYTIAEWDTYSAMAASWTHAW